MKLEVKLAIVQTVLLGLACLLLLDLALVGSPARLTPLETVKLVTDTTDRLNAYLDSVNNAISGCERRIKDEEEKDKSFWTERLAQLTSEKEIVSKDIEAIRKIGRLNASSLYGRPPLDN